MNKLHKIPAAPEQAQHDDGIAHEAMQIERVGFVTIVIDDLADGEASSMLWQITR